MRLSAQLTEAEVRALERRAAAELRSMASYVGGLVAEELERKPVRRRVTQARPGDRRSGYELALPLTRSDRRALEARAEAEGRSVSSLVAALILADLERA